MQVVICDKDKEYAHQIMKELTSKSQNMIEFQYVCDGESFTKCVKESKNPDLILMDILSGSSEHSVNGIELVSKAAPFIRKSLVVFISDSCEYITDVYEVPHFAFILKREMIKRCNWLLGKIRGLQKHKSLLFLESGKKKTMIPTWQILYLERDRRSTYIHTTEGEYRSSAKLVDFQQQLDEKMFARCHNSYIVNLDYVTAYHRTEFYIEHDKKIPISRSRQKEMKLKLDSWIDEKK